jgi:hypothetical protein
MSFDKGLQLSNSSLLPKDSQSAFGNIQTTAEGDASTYSSSAAYSLPNLQNHLPPPPPLDISYQHSSYPLQPSEQVYHLHVPQTTFGTTHHLPLQYPWSTTRYDATFAPPTPLFGGYSESRIKAFSESRGTLPGHRYDIGYRAAPTALPLRDSQRTLVELPRFTSFQDQENSLRSHTDDPGGIAPRGSKEFSNRSFAQFGKSLSEFVNLSLISIFRLINSQTDISVQRIFPIGREGHSCRLCPTTASSFSVAHRPTRQPSSLGDPQSRTSTSKSTGLAQNDQDPRQRSFLSNAAPTSFRHRQHIGHGRWHFVTFCVRFQSFKR